MDKEGVSGINMVMKSMFMMNREVNDLIKWSDIIDLRDFTEEELVKLNDAYSTAAIATMLINETIYNTCIRKKNEGMDLIARAESKRIRKELLKGVNKCKIK